MPSAVPTMDEDYDITLFFDPSVDANSQGYFTNAKNKWESVITGDLPPRSTPGSTGFVTKCGINGPAEEIDDLWICTKLEPIDGEGGTGGRARPVARRGGTLLPFTGEMYFDSADVPNFSPSLFEGFIVSCRLIALVV